MIRVDQKMTQKYIDILYGNKDTIKVKDFEVSFSDKRRDLIDLTLSNHGIEEIKLSAYPVV